jgi:hypothetical protein
MNSRTSLKYPALLLKADGSVEPLAVKPGPFQPSVVVLARARCLFERMTPPAGVKGAAAVAAARLHADSGAPYQRAGALITQKDGVFGIWWWDAQWVGEKLGGAGLDPTSPILPEPLARQTGEGWRIVKATTGYEAQLWRGGFLLADHWRRDPFDTAAWEDFVRTQPDAQGGGEAILIAQNPPFVLQNPYRKTLLSAWTPERSAQAAMMALAAVLVCTALWFAGQAVGLNKAAEAAQAELDQLKAGSPAAANMQKQVAGLVALRSETSGADPLVMLKEAQQIISPYGHKVLAYKTGRELVRIYLPTEAAEDLGILSRELAASPYFSSVKPTLDRRRGRLILDLVPKTAKPVKGKAAPKPAPTAAVS